MKSLKVVVLVIVLLAAVAVCAAPAPPLTSVAVIKVASAQVPAGEAITAYQYSTVRDHGGAYLDVTTREMGYAINRRAAYNSAPMIQTAVTYIMSGTTVVGFTRTWRTYNPAPSGRFAYQATSQVYPVRTLSCSLSIR